MVESYHSPSQILAGLYIAPAGEATGTVYLIHLPEGTSIVGPESAINAVNTDPAVKGQLTLHPDWASGNILLYLINGQFTYIIPYYGTSGNLTVPVMVAAVDGATKKVGSYQIQHPTDASEVQNAANQAVQREGLTVSTSTTVMGTVYNVTSYVKNGATQLTIGINTGAPKAVYVYGSADKLTATDFTRLVALTPGKAVSVQVDSSNNILSVN